VAALTGGNDSAFAAALETQLNQAPAVQAFGGIGDSIQSGLATVGGWIGNGVSDLILMAKRRDLSKGVAFFLGDIFVYLRQHDLAGDQGVQARLFKPILDDLINAFKAPRQQGEPFVVVGHSLGGVLLYDLLTDPKCLRRLEAEAAGFKIDLLTTVGSQPGFFADLKLYRDKPQAGNLLAKPANVAAWHNVFDYTDVFSFLAGEAFDGVTDFGYDTAVDVMAAHSAYFKRPSFYQRMRKRLQGLGFS
jgi:pimeloyl-ACP methyl ester carboxylesterase